MPVPKHIPDSDARNRGFARWTGAKLVDGDVTPTKEETEREVKLAVDTIRMAIKANIPNVNCLGRDKHEQELIKQALTPEERAKVNFDRVSA